jgi:UDP-2,3-diacylglucosamine pyrophosphatase LpxH
MEASFDYLVVSDLHLRGGFSNPTAGLYHFDEEFADFLRYYRLHRASQRPWQLIIGGDFIEFLYVTDRPDPNAPLLRGATISESEIRYGASTEAQKARWKLDTILRRSHPQLLLALARFVAEGNYIQILRGNHDVEIFWPEVQEHLRRLIAEHHPDDVSYMAMKQTVAQRVQFPDWFVYVPGLLYVEHGCQYDEFCCFQHFLYPVVPTRPTRIQNSISELSVRYFTNQMKVINAMAAENINSIGEYVGWILRGNVAILPRVFSLYGAMVRRILAKSGPGDPEAERVVRTEHERRVAATDERFGLPAGTAAAVNGMHATPVMRSRVAAARFLALDLFAAGGVLLATVAVILIAYPARTGLLALVGAAGAVLLILYIGALRFRRVLAYGQLQGIADRLGELFQVPYVILGHSHDAQVRPLRDGRSYINVGTWVPEGEAAYFVYFAVTGDEAPRRGRLWRWNKREAQPQPFGTEKDE